MKDARTLDQLAEKLEVGSPVDAAAAAFPRLDLDAGQAARLADGGPRRQASGFGPLKKKKKKITLAGAFRNRKLWSRNLIAGAAVLFFSDR